MADNGAGFGAFVQNMARNIHMGGTGIDPNKIFTTMANQRLQTAMMDSMQKRAEIMAGAQSDATKMRARATYAASLAAQNLTAGQISEKMKIFDDAINGIYTKDPVVPVVPKKGFDLSWFKNLFGGGNKGTPFTDSASVDDVLNRRNANSAFSGQYQQAKEEYNNILNMPAEDGLPKGMGSGMASPFNDMGSSYNSEILAPIVVKNKKKG